MCKCKTCNALKNESLHVENEYLVFNNQIKVEISELRLLRWKSAFYDRGLKPSSASAFYHSQNIQGMMKYPEMLTPANKDNILENLLLKLKD